MPLFCKGSGQFSCASVLSTQPICTGQEPLRSSFNDEFSVNIILITIRPETLMVVYSCGESGITCILSVFPNLSARWGVRKTPNICNGQNSRNKPKYNPIPQCTCAELIHCVQLNLYTKESSKVRARSVFIFDVYTLILSPNLLKQL